MCQFLPGRLSTLRWRRNQSLMPGSRSQNWMFHRTTAYPTERRWGWREIIEVGETQLTWGSWTVTPQGCVEKTNICNYSIGKKIPPRKLYLLCNFEYSQKSQSPQNRKTKRSRFWFEMSPNYFKDTSTDNHTIESDNSERVRAFPS